jgi:hypothetical protein
MDDMLTHNRSREQLPSFEFDFEKESGVHLTIRIVTQRSSCLLNYFQHS